MVAAPRAHRTRCHACADLPMSGYRQRAMGDENWQGLPMAEVDTAYASVRRPKPHVSGLEWRIEPSIWRVSKGPSVAAISDGPHVRHPGAGRGCMAVLAFRLRVDRVLGLLEPPAQALPCVQLLGRRRYPLKHLNLIVGRA
jgi:hypothetical protein